MTSPLYSALTAEARQLVAGTTTAPPADYARHEAGHVVVAWWLGVPVRHTTLLASPCHPGPHTCTSTVDPLLRSAIRWAGAIVDRSLAWSSQDFADLGGMRAHLPGRWFDLAETIIANHGREVDLIAAALADPVHAGVLFSEDVAALLGG